MTNKALKHLCLLIVCIMAGIGSTSCSSDDNPSGEVIPQLNQKLIGGMWIAGKVDKGNIVTISFKEENKAVFNVIMSNKEYVKQETYSYEVKGNTIFTGKYQIKVKSFSDKSMDVEVTNFPEDGLTYSATYIRRYPTVADNIENTSWTIKKSVPWIEANKDELTLPGNLMINGKRTISLKNLPSTFNQMMMDEYWHVLFYDDNTMAQVTCYDDKVQVWSLPYTLDGYKMSCSATIGDYEGKINYTVFKTEEGNLFFIYEKEAVMAYMIGFYTMQATVQGFEITRKEWDAFANELDASLDKADFILIFEPDNSGSDYTKETLMDGKWIWEDGDSKEVMNFLPNGQMLNTVIGEENHVFQYKYFLTGNKLKLVNMNDVEFQYSIYMASDQMTIVGHDFSRVYTRQASTESE